MDIRVSGKNVGVTQGMKEHLEEKLVKLDKYAPRIVEAHVILVKEKYLFKTEITLLAKNLKAYGEGQSKENVFTAMDLAYARVETQLKKFRERIKDHHKKTANHSAEILANFPDAEDLDSQDEQPDIIPSADFSPKPMSAEEASLQLKMSPKSFIVFLNAKTKRVNVIYKREDGHHGLIEPNY